MKRTPRYGDDNNASAIYKSSEKKMKKDYSGGIVFILFFAIIIGLGAYAMYSWKPDKIISEKYVGTVRSINITNGVITSPNTDRFLYVINIDTGHTYVLAKGIRGWEIKINDKAWIVTAVLNGGKSKLVHFYLGIENEGSKKYYLLAE